MGEEKGRHGKEVTVLKGILLAGGSGTRLYPLTCAVSKQLLPVHERPMIYYPLCLLLEAGIREILVISTPSDVSRYRTLLGDGRRFGGRLSYAVQPSPDGVAQALLIAKEFVGADAVALALGDNLFLGSRVPLLLREAMERAEQSGRATVFACAVRDPERFGVVTLDENGRALSLVEKPSLPESDLCVTGLYVYGADAVDQAGALRPSARGELEISDLNRRYLEAGRLEAVRLPEDTVWLDTGTPESLYEASVLVRALEKRTRRLFASPEEIAWRKGWITDREMRAFAEEIASCAYGKALLGLLDGGESREMHKEREVEYR